MKMNARIDREGNAMPTPREVLIHARIQSGQSIEEISRKAQVPSATYYDLESHEEDVHDAVSLADLRRVCDVLNISLSDLFRRPTATELASTSDFSALAEALSHYLQEHTVTVGEFETMAGWEVAEFLERPNSAWNWTVDYLRDVCNAIGVDWHSFLAAIVD